MVIDFSDLKHIVENEIINVFDHAVALSSSFKNKTTGFSDGIFGNIVFLDYQPTCENLVADFAERIAGKLPAGVDLHSLRLYETATSYAEWYASDNQ
jgi:6-pyruvoyltetrahydropterin/6-carboxytetrahydropterin synthase